MAFNVQAGHFTKELQSFLHCVSSSGVVLWFSVLMIVAVVLFIPRFYRIVSIEVLIPYVHRELERLRQCVEKCATPEQFVAYTDAEHKARTIVDLKALVAQAKTIINQPFALADEILECITDNVEPVSPTPKEDSTKT